MGGALSFRVEIEERDGWFTATSQDLPGLCLAHTDLESILNGLPWAIGVLLSKSHGRDYHVVRSPYAGDPDSDRAPWVAIPPEIASAQLAA